MINIYKLLNAFLLLIICITSTASFAENLSITDPNKPPEQQQLYNEAYEYNQNASKDWRPDETNRVINELIIAQRNFLPIYIEKARFIIIDGFIKRTNMQKVGIDALTILRDVQEKDPTYPALYVLAGHVYTFLGDYPQAEESLRKAQQLGSTEPWLDNNWADLLKRQGRNSEAMPYALEALKRAKNNKKALAASAELISYLRGAVQEKMSTQELLNLIFATYKDPEIRLLIAERFIESFNGQNNETFEVAEKIILRVKKEYPDLRRSDLEEARLLMVKGYLIRKNFADHYTPESTEKARRLLMPLRDDETIMQTAYGLLINLDFSDDNLQAASNLIDEADQKSLITDDFINKKRGQLHLIKGDYPLAVYFFEEAAKTDPRMKYNRDLIEAYTFAGQTDKIEAHFIRDIDWDPKSAWAKGNYANYLLMKNGNADRAIEYSRQALAIMNYPHARHTLFMALYLKWAQTLIIEKNAEKSQPYFEEAYTMMPDMTYVFNEANKADATRIVSEALQKTKLYRE